MTQSPGQWPDPYQSPAQPSSTPPAPPTYPAYQTPPPNPYGAVPGYGGAPYPVARPTNGMALAAMIVSLAGIITCISFPIGAVLGHVALKQVRETGQEGEAFAKTGIIVGWIGTGLGLLGCIGYIVFFAALATSIPTT
jgi:hypothetical protein